MTCVFTDTKRGRIFVEKYVVNEYTGEGFNPHDFPFDFDPELGRCLLAEARRGPRQRLDPGCESPTTSPRTRRPSGRSERVHLRRPDGRDRWRIDPGRSASGEEVYCTFTNELKIHPGSSGFWKNWRNHYDRASST